MKKILSIILSFVMLISLISAVPVGAISESEYSDLEFLSSTYFCENFYNRDGIPCQRYYRIIDEIVYSFVVNPDYGSYDAVVVYVSPETENPQFLEEITDDEGDSLPVASTDADKNRGLGSIRFLDLSTFYIDTEDEFSEPFREYYKIIDGAVYYTGTYVEDEIVDFAKVIAIVPEKPSSKVKIVDEITIKHYILHKVKVNRIEIEDSYFDLARVEELEIANGITSVIGVKNSSNLKKVIFGKNLGYIEDSFHHCDNLEIEIHPENQNFISENGELYRIAVGKKLLVSVFKTTEHYEIKEGTTSFLAPFGKDKNLKTLTINSNLDDFKTGKLKKLKTINIGEEVTKINKIDLTGTESIKTLDLSKIKIKLFKAQGVWALTDVKLPEKCYIARQGFIRCKKLKEITVPKNNKKIRQKVFSGCENLEKVTVLADEVRIYGNAFRLCKNLKIVDMSKCKKVPVITASAFKRAATGIKFYVKNKTVAKQLKSKLKGKVKNAKIYAKGKLVYKNVK